MDDTNVWSGGWPWNDLVENILIFKTHDAICIILIEI